ncbi:MAG: hypothetical protein AB8G14_15750 [Ilumatobacter sp.]
MSFQTFRRLLLISGLIAGASACSALGLDDSATIEVTFTSDTVDEVTIYRDARSPESPGLHNDPDPEDIPDPYAFTTTGEVVTLPWSTTITVDDSIGSDSFSILALNESGDGEITCDADWKQADGDGSWGRTNEFIAGCSADISFRDDGRVRLEPSGRSVSFETRDERRAEAQAERDAIVERRARVAEATDAAAAPGPIELDGWLIELTGATRREYELVVEVTAERLIDEPGRPTDIQIGALGGFDLNEYTMDDHECNPGYESSALTTYGLLTEFGRGEGGVWNVCLLIDSLNVPGALGVVSVFLGDDEPVVLRLPDNGATGTRNEVDGAVEFTDFDTGLLVELIDAHVDDVALIDERIGDGEPNIREELALVMVDIDVTNLDPAGYGPFPPNVGVDWVLETADGARTYGPRDRCPGVFDVFPAEPSPQGGVDWNNRGGFDAVPGIPRVFADCFEVRREDLEGLVFRIIGIGTDSTVTLSTGL